MRVIGRRRWSSLQYQWSVISDQFAVCSDQSQSFLVILQEDAVEIDPSDSELAKQISCTAGSSSNVQFTVAVFFVISQEDAVEIENSCIAGSTNRWKVTRVKNIDNRI